MTARDAHWEAVNACSAKVTDIKGLIGQLSDACRELVGMVEEATGGLESPTDAGRTSTETAKMLEELVTNEPTRLAEVLDAELVRYANGF